MYNDKASSFFIDVCITFGKYNFTLVDLNDTKGTRYFKGEVGLL